MSITKKCVKKSCKKTDFNKNNSTKQNSLNNITNYKSYLLDDNDDENEVVDWLEDNICNNKEYFDCGCCDECLCDDNIECTNCGCNCNGDDIDDEYDYDSDNDSYDDSYDDYDNSNLSNFNINIIKNEVNEKLVRITLQLNVMLDNKKKEIINIDLDINTNTYLKIAEELFKNK